MGVHPAVQGLLFINGDGSPIAVQQALKQPGAPPAEYSGHCFRIGAATMTADENFTIKMLVMLRISSIPAL